MRGQQWGMSEIPGKEYQQFQEDEKILLTVEEQKRMKEKENEGGLSFQRLR